MREHLAYNMAQKLMDDGMRDEDFEAIPEAHRGQILGAMIELTVLEEYERKQQAAISLMRECMSTCGQNYKPKRKKRKVANRN